MTDLIQLLKNVELFLGCPASFRYIHLPMCLHSYSLYFQKKLYIILMHISTSLSYNHGGTELHKFQWSRNNVFIELYLKYFSCNVSSVFSSIFVNRQLFTVQDMQYCFWAEGKGTKIRLDLKHFSQQDTLCSLPRRSQFEIFPPSKKTKNKKKKQSLRGRQDPLWHRGCHQVILCQEENVSLLSCFTVGCCWEGHESVVCWLSYRAVLEIDDVYAITSKLIDSPQASIELLRSWINNTPFVIVIFSVDF